MKKYLVLFLAIALFAACGKDDDTATATQQQPSVAPEPEPEPEPVVVEPGYLVSVTDSAFFSVQEFGNEVSNSAMVNYADQFVEGSTAVLRPAIQNLVTARKPVLDAMFLARVGLDKSLRPQYRIESYVFTFNTLSASGQPIVLSGRVTFPNNTVAGTTHELDTYTLFSHQYVMAADWVPSQCLSMMSLRSLYNSAVIEPDAQGYGSTINSESVAFLSFNARARQLADCVRAAREIMQRRDVRLSSSGYTTNWGSSLGAPVALAFARYYDIMASENERKALRLKSSYVGEGPLDYAATLLYMDEHPTYRGAIASAFYGLGALSTEQLHGYEATDFMPQWMSTAMVPWSDGEYSYFYAAAHVMAGYNRYSQRIKPDTMFINTLSADMYHDNLRLDRDAPKTQMLMQILHEQGDWSGWKPQTTIYFAHAEADDNIPCATVKDIYNQLRQQAGTNKSKLHWLTVETDHNIAVNDLGLGPHYGPSIEAMMFMALAYEPKDMTLFYHEN